MGKDAEIIDEDASNCFATDPRQVEPAVGRRIEPRQASQFFLETLEAKTQAQPLLVLSKDRPSVFDISVCFHLTNFYHLELLKI